MASTPRLGAKVRALRRRKGLTQARLAELLGISPSYLNLIEHNRRPLPAALLIRLAGQFELDLQAFAADDDSRLIADLMEVFGDDLFQPFGLTNADVRELVGGSPNVARSIRALYEAYQGSREQADTLASRLATGEATGATTGRPGHPSEEVSDFLQRHHNHFADLEEAAEELWDRAGLDLNRLQGGLVDHLQGELGIEVQFVHAGSLGQAVRRFDPERRVLSISEVLPPRSRHFQLAHVVGLLSHEAVLDGLSDDQWLTTPDSRALARVVLANYYAGAVLMPYVPFLEAARARRYDIELLGHRFRVSFEQVCHRLTTLQRAGASGVPFYLIRIDVAGNISKKFSATSMRFPRYSGLCPKWNAFQAFMMPGSIRTQVSRLSETTGYFSLARTLRKGEAGWHSTHVVHAVELGCEVEAAHELVYADGVDLDSRANAVPVGITCRLCQRMRCEQRAVPSIYEPMRVDENVRGAAFYVSVTEDRGD